jgi:hypothetical protein
MHLTKCGYCGKHVAEKPILGTMHFCLPPEERAQIDRLRQLRQQIAMQRQFVEKQEPLGEPFSSILHANAWNLYAR